MEVRAIAKYVRVQPRKVRIVADEVRGKNASHTVSLLRYHPAKSAKALRKVLVSAIANAQENHGLSADSLRIAEIRVDEGPKMKRLQARAQGRGNRILKKTSHITVVVEDVEPAKKVKPHGTKAKPRPTFAAPAPKSGGRKKKAAEEPVAQAEPATEETNTAEEPVAATEAAPAEDVAVKEAEPAEGAAPAAEEPAEEKGAE
jgi:large subunit ribosomal protein L22